MGRLRETLFGLDISQNEPLFEGNNSGGISVHAEVLARQEAYETTVEVPVLQIAANGLHTVAGNQIA